MPTKFRELEKILRNNGWICVRASGSHYIFRHPEKGTVSVPFHGDNKEMKPGTLRAILKKADLVR